MKKSKKIGQGAYCCSNPNCGKVFFRPKIIKYYVCPSCQTLIDIPTQTILDQVTSTKKHSSSLKKQKPKSTLTQNQPVSNIEIGATKKSVSNEPIDLKLESVEECDPKTISIEEKVQLAVEGKVVSELSFLCSYYLGYLKERTKGQVIPETCFGCPKSLECMLPKENISSESVQELKKWYFSTNNE